MTPYKNLAHNSGILAYEIGKSFIKVKFRDGMYTYNYSRPGKKAVDAMKLLAVKGRGLSTYISRVVRDNYALKRDN